MRGSFFAKPLEIILEIEGERWKQGETLRGQLILKNRGGQPASAQDLDIQYCRAQLSAVKKKAQSAFKMISEHRVSGEIPPQGEARHSFEFQLGQNAPVTDSVSSAFVRCGPGALQLQIEVSPVIGELISTLQSQHHFGLKSIKNSKSGVEIKMSAPDGRKFATLEALVLNVAFQVEGGSKNSDLRVQYDFQVKQVGAGATPLKVGTGSRAVEQVLSSSDYLTTSGRVNFETIRNFVAEAVATVESKIIF
ncbi:hypothetical protein EBZ37_05515 [bacterium]|nr:hypothetical protein [bacterium]